MRGALVDAVRGAHANGERAALGAVDKLLGLVGVGVGVLALDRRAVVLLAADLAKLRLDGDVHSDGDLGHALGESHVVLEGNVGAVDHDGGVAGTQSLHAAVEAVAVVEVQCHGNACGVGSHANHGGKVVEVGVLDGARRGLHDDGGVLVLGGLDDGHHKLEVLHVERTHGVVAGLGVEQHFLGCDEHRALPSRAHGGCRGSSLSATRLYRACLWPWFGMRCVVCRQRKASVSARRTTLSLRASQCFPKRRKERNMLVISCF